MTDAAQARTVVVERDLAHPPAKVWRALTQPHLLSEWLMRTDFAPNPGQAFRFEADWGAVTGEVLEIEPETRLAYSWSAHGLESVVTWTLTPTAGGTRLRMEQVGFRPDQEQAYRGAQMGWPRFFAALDELLARTPAA